METNVLLCDTSTGWCLPIITVNTDMVGDGDGWVWFAGLKFIGLVTVIGDIKIPDVD